VGASLDAESDYQFRGLSLSRSQPALSINVSWDSTAGPYAGASGIGETTDGFGVQPLGYIVYAGDSGRVLGDASWDLGVIQGKVFIYDRYRYDYDYTEAYVGFARGDLSGHLYYSPNYLGQGPRTLYAELNDGWKLAPQWRLTGHVGVLAAVGGQPGPYAGGTPVDLRLGVARDFKRVEFHVFWTGRTTRAVYLLGQEQSRSAVFAGLVCFF
jgi:uncharacterized protein (TIGR02001 family)